MRQYSLLHTDSMFCHQHSAALPRRLWLNVFDAAHEISALVRSVCHSQLQNTTAMSRTRWCSNGTYYRTCRYIKLAVTDRLNTSDREAVTTRRWGELTAICWRHPLSMNYCTTVVPLARSSTLCFATNCHTPPHTHVVISCYNSNVKDADEIKTASLLRC